MGAGGAGSGAPRRVSFPVGFFLGGNPGPVSLAGAVPHTRAPRIAHRTEPCAFKSDRDQPERAALLRERARAPPPLRDRSPRAAAPPELSRWQPSRFGAALPRRAGAARSPVPRPACPPGPVALPVRGTEPRPRWCRAPRGTLLPLRARGPAWTRAATYPGQGRSQEPPSGQEQRGARSGERSGRGPAHPPPSVAKIVRPLRGPRGRDPGPRRPRHRPLRGARSRPPRAPPRFRGRGGPAGTGHYLTSRRRITVAQRYAAHQWSSNVSKFEEG